MNFRNYYRRPRETHRCGLSAAGRSCVHGPNGRQCGQSRDIPERCTPVRTLLGWSRLASAICTLLAIGTLSYWFTISKNNVPIAPGHLSKAHAQLLVSGVSDHPLSIDDEKRCAACHPNSIPKSNGSLASSNHVQASPVNMVAVKKQSELCMSCHYGTMPNGLLGNPHDLTGEDLKDLFASVTEGYPTKLSQEPTECSQCHREHQGSEGIFRRFRRQSVKLAIEINLNRSRRGTQNSNRIRPTNREVLASITRGMQNCISQRKAKHSIAVFAICSHNNRDWLVPCFVACPLSNHARNAITNRSRVQALRG